MGFYEDQILPRITNVLLGNPAIGSLRREMLEGTSGTDLEIGFGSGTNLDHYPDRVERVLAVDPATVGRKLARDRIARSRIAVEFVGLDGQAIPLPDAAADAAVSAFTLCTVPDPASALAEIARIVRPGGRLHFLEHGLSDDPRVARAQHRYNGIERKIAGGCNLDRAHDALLEAAGFRIEHLRRFTMRGPAPLSPMYLGVAIAPD